MKKQAKKVFLGTFWEILTKKLRFFCARSPSKLVYIRAKGIYRKVLGSVTKMDISNYYKGGTLWVGRLQNDCNFRLRHLEDIYVL